MTRINQRQILGGSAPDLSKRGTVVRYRHQLGGSHATMLNQLGVDHRRLTFRSGGRDHRLTDVHGELITEAIA